MLTHPTRGKGDNGFDPGFAQRVVPRAYWPGWAEGLVGQAEARDAGIGDVVWRVVPERERAAWVQGRCGCPKEKVREELNRRYPLPEKS